MHPQQPVLQQQNSSNGMQNITTKPISSHTYQGHFT